jgi:hypothetical protein
MAADLAMANAERATIARAGASGLEPKWLEPKWLRNLGSTFCFVKILEIYAP